MEPAWPLAVFLNDKTNIKLTIQVSYIHKAHIIRSISNLVGLTIISTGKQSYDADIFPIVVICAHSADFIVYNKREILENMWQTNSFFKKAIIILFYFCYDEPWRTQVDAYIADAAYQWTMIGIFLKHGIVGRQLMPYQQYRYCN